MSEEEEGETQKNQIEEDKFRERVRKEFNRIPHLRFPLGNKATFDDLLMNPNDHLKILAIIEYKIEFIGKNKGEYRLSTIGDTQQSIAINSDKWGDYVVFIVKLRQTPTLDAINGLVNIKPIQRMNPYLIMITVGKAIKPFLKGGKMYYSTKRFKSADVRDYIKQEKIVFCKSVSDLPEKLEKIFNKLLEIQESNSFGNAYFGIYSRLLDIKLGVQHKSINRRYLTQIELNLSDIRGTLSYYGFKITEIFDKCSDLLTQHLINTKQGFHPDFFELENPTLFKSILRKFEIEIQDITRGCKGRIISI